MIIVWIGYLEIDLEMLSRDASIESARILFSTYRLESSGEPSAIILVW